MQIELYKIPLKNEMLRNRSFPKLFLQVDRKCFGQLSRWVFARIDQPLDKEEWTFIHSENEDLVGAWFYESPIEVEKIKDIIRESESIRAIGTFSDQEKARLSKLAKTVEWAEDISG